VTVYQLLYLVGEYVIAESPRSGLVAFIPIDSQVDEMSLIDGDNPVVRVVFVYDLSHFCHLLV
jgi:hypothetical protein